jgi:hypothetical protein
MSTSKRAKQTAKLNDDFGRPRRQSHLDDRRCAPRELRSTLMALIGAGSHAPRSPFLWCHFFVPPSQQSECAPVSITKESPSWGASGVDAARRLPLKTCGSSRGAHAAVVGAQFGTEAMGEKQV